MSSSGGPRGTPDSVAGPPAPDLPQHERDWTRPHSEMLKLAAAHAPSPGTTHGDCPGCQMAADVRTLVAENEHFAERAAAWLAGAAVPAPLAGPFGLIPCPDCEGSGRQPLGEHHVTHEMALDAGQPEREGESMGIEYGPCPTCSGNGQLEAPPVSPGAPAAARRAPTDAMIEAIAAPAFEAAEYPDGLWRAQSDVTKAYWRERAERWLRAALGAARDGPA